MAGEGDPMKLCGHHRRMIGGRCFVSGACRCEVGGFLDFGPRPSSRVDLAFFVWPKLAKSQLRPSLGHKVQGYQNGYLLN